jgi:hypothetical protein
MVKFWNQETWTLSDTKEIYINKSATLKDLAKSLESHFNIDQSLLSVCKINSPWNFHRVQLPFESWTPLIENSDLSLTSQPFYLSTDGILFILKDLSQTERDMTPQEKEDYHCKDFE